MQLKKQIVLSYGITTIPNTSTLIPTLDKPRINLRIYLRHDTNLNYLTEGSGLSEEGLFKAMACKSDTH